MPNTGTLSKGWLDLTLPLGVVGYIVLRQSATGQPDHEAVVPLSTVSSQLADLVFDGTSFTTGVAITNPGTASITVNITAYKSDGSQLGTGAVTLAARGKTSVPLSSIGGLSGITGSRGRATFTTASGSFALLGLRFGGVAFTTIPVNYR